jgi:hypothetical protein
MTANVTSTGGVSDKSYGPARRQPDDKTPSGAEPEARPPAPGPDDQMLVIEEDPEVGGFVYTTIDRRTGAVLHKLNRSELLKLREAATYAAGAVLSARA